MNSPAPDRSIRLAAMVLGYNQEDYIGYCIRDICSDIDEVIVAIPSDPYVAYNPSARREFTTRDATREIVETISIDHPNVRITLGSWESEEAMRSHCLKLALGLGCNACMIIDADEFYPPGSISIVRDALELGQPGQVFWARHLNCFRRFDRVVDAPNLRLPVAVIPDRTTSFVQGRVPSGVRCDLPGDIFYWHVGYVLSNERMWEKLRTFSHAHEVVPHWFEEKWLAWSPETTNLCRRRPERWPRTMPCDRDQLPMILHSHPRFLEESGQRA